MAGGFIAVGSCMSAATSNQVIAFILSVMICFLFVVAGFPIVLDAFQSWAPASIVDAIGALSSEQPALRDLFLETVCLPSPALLSPLSSCQ
jgi:hypothetical protein